MGTLKPGKAFEHDVEASGTDAIQIDRLEDGHDNKTKKQPADFIMWDGQIKVYVECKETQEDSIQFSRLTQIPLMYSKVNRADNTEGYFLFNFVESDITLCMSVEKLILKWQLGPSGYLKIEDISPLCFGVPRKPCHESGRTWEYDLDSMFEQIRKEKHYK